MTDNFDRDCWNCSYGYLLRDDKDTGYVFNCLHGEDAKEVDPLEVTGEFGMGCPDYEFVEIPF